MDVQHPATLVDAVHRTFLDAGTVEEVNTRLGDHIGHVGSPRLGSARRGDGREGRTSITRAGGSDVLARPGRPAPATADTGDRGHNRFPAVILAFSRSPQI